MANEEKTEKATPKKREESREQGQSSKSAELTGTLVLIACVAVLVLTAKNNLNITQAYMVDIFSHLDGGEITLPAVDEIASKALDYLTQVVGPLFGVAMIVAIAGNLLQEKLHLAKKALTPKFSRMNPAKGFKKIFSSQSVVEFAKGMVKLVVLGGISYWLLSGATEELLSLVGVPSQVILTLVGSLATKLVFACVAVLLAIAIPDLIYTKWSFEKSIRMTKKEITDEMKEQEGDPLLKGEIRRKMRAASLQRMMTAVPTADVVVTNPIHFAVALKYENEKGAPQVVAKGARLVAQRIKDLAKEHRVPIVENPPLARALYKSVEIGAFIPKELYQAVAELLAFVYQLGQRKI